MVTCGIGPVRRARQNRCPDSARKEGDPRATYIFERGLLLARQKQWEAGEKAIESFSQSLDQDQQFIRRPHTTT